jgi:hypothetical protein
MSSGQYFALDEVGGEVWELLAEPRRLDDLASAIAEAYDAPLEVIRTDLSDLLADLASEALVEIDA